MHKIFLVFLFSLTACQTAPNTKTPPAKQSLEDDKIEGESKIQRSQGLTNMFSYHQLRWENNEVMVVQKLGTPIATAANKPLKLLTFATKTRGFPTLSTTGFLDDKFVTLDISIQDKAQCLDAIPGWINALSLKYGPPKTSKDTYISWKLEDGTQIAIEKSAECGIVYAHSAADRKAVDTLVGAAISNKY